MSECTRVGELLVLHVEGALDPAERARVEEHLAACAACRAEVEEIKTVRRWLSDPSVFEAERPEFATLPRLLAERAGRAPSPRVPSNWGSGAWTAAMAASLALGCALVWFAHRQLGAPSPVAAQGNAAFLRQMESTYEREAT